MSRADRFTIERKKPQLYSDFTVNFDRNPLTGLLAVVTNEDAVKSSIRNLVKTMRRERPNQPLVGSKVYTLLGEPIDTVTTTQLQDTILETIRNNEPRALNPVVQVEPLSEQNAYRLTVVFGIVNIPQQVMFSTLLRRIR